MKPTRHVTAALLLLAGSAAVGCSKSSETVEAKAASSASAAVKPVATTGEKRTDGEGSLPTVTPKITSPMSFSDGQAAYQARKYSDATAIFDRYTTERPANAWGHYMNIVALLTATEIGSAWAGNTSNAKSAGRNSRRYLIVSPLWVGTFSDVRQERLDRLEMSRRRVRTQTGRPGQFSEKCAGMLLSDDFRKLSSSIAV